ncbi:MAG: 2-phosphosulfolactate phosphatase [Bacillota bacterium]
MNVEIVIRKEDISLKKNLKKKAVIVIDVLRATSTMVTALNNGCREIIVAPTPQAGLKLRSLYGSAVVLGGERKREKISGYDLGNSPREYKAGNIAGKILVFTTTNGTALINSCSGASSILIAAFLNARAVASSLNDSPDILIACAGTKGTFSLEDYLLAGYILKLIKKQHVNAVFNDECFKAVEFYDYLQKDLEGILLRSPHGLNLKMLGMERDVVYCLQKDIINQVPRVAANCYYPRIQLMPASPRI